jgi:two-component system, LytTR family, response regulator
MGKIVIKTIIVDDEKEAIFNLVLLLKDLPSIEIIGTIHDSKDAISIIEEARPDLLFLDIDMPGKSGFEIVTELYVDGFKPDIIFATAFDEFAIQAIRYAAFDYLVKPVNKDELRHAVNRLCLKQQGKPREEQINLLRERTTPSDKIKINTSGGFTLIRPADILYIQADWNYAEIFFNKDKSELVTINIGELEKSLLPDNFFRLNRSIIINTGYLSKVSRKKQIAYLNKDGQEYTFKIPLLNIRKLERYLEE